MDNAIEIDDIYIYNHIYIYVCIYIYMVALNNSGVVHYNAMKVGVA